MTLARKMRRALPALLAGIALTVGLVGCADGPVPGTAPTDDSIGITDTHGDYIQLQSSSTIICVETDAFLMTSWTDVVGKAQISRASASRYPEQDDRCLKATGEPKPDELRITDTHGDPVSVELTVVCLGEQAFLAVEKAALARFPEQDHRCS